MLVLCTLFRQSLNEPGLRFFLIILITSDSVFPVFSFISFLFVYESVAMSAFPQPRDVQYHESLSGLTLSEDDFLALLEKVIGESKYVQNNPRQGLVPEEGRVAAHILGELEPYSTSNGGPLEITKLEYVPNRPNINGKSTQNRSKIEHKSTKNRPGAKNVAHFVLGAVLEASWRRLGGV